MKIPKWCAVSLAAASILLCPPAAPSPASASVSGLSTWCSALAAGAPVLDLLGDSNTEAGSVDPGQRWHAELGASLRTDGAPNTQIWIGGAIPGSATADYVAGARYSNHIEFTVHHPDLIVLGWGTNDWSAGIPVAQFRDQYQQIIDRIRVLSPGSELALVHMPWVYGPLTSTRGSQVPYQAVIRDLSAVNNALFIDLVWPFAGNDPFGLKTADGVHLTAAGQNVQFGVMRAAIVAPCS